MKCLLISNLSSRFSICLFNRSSSLSSHISFNMQSRICSIVNLSVNSLISIKLWYLLWSKSILLVTGSFFWSSIWISSVMNLIRSVPIIKLLMNRSFGMLLLFGISIYAMKDHMLYANILKQIIKLKAQWMDCFK